MTDLVKKCLPESAFHNLKIYSQRSHLAYCNFCQIRHLARGPSFASLLCASRLLEKLAKLSLLPHLPNCWQNFVILPNSLFLHFWTTGPRATRWPQKMKLKDQYFSFKYRSFFFIICLECESVSL